MKKQNNKNLIYIIGMSSQLALYIVIPTLGFLFLGKWLDTIVHTPPLFLILGILLGSIMSIGLLYQAMKKLMRENK